MSSRVLGSSGEGLVKACVLGERHPRLALELRGRPGDWGGLEEVLGQLRAEERHLRETVPPRSRSRS